MERASSHNQSKSKRVAVVAIAALLLAVPASASNDEASEIGINAASAGLTLLYGPLKLTYSALGLVFGGIAYGLSGGDSDVFKAVVTPAVRGDYIVTPKHVRQEESLEFVGRDPAYREEVVDVGVYEEIY